jgi:hypothetical protein
MSGTQSRSTHSRISGFIYKFATILCLCRRLSLTTQTRHFASSSSPSRMRDLFRRRPVPPSCQAPSSAPPPPQQPRSAALLRTLAGAGGVPRGGEAWAAAEFTRSAPPHPPHPSPPPPPPRPPRRPPPGRSRSESATPPLGRRRGRAAQAAGTHPPPGLGLLKNISLSYGVSQFDVKFT